MEWFFLATLISILTVLVAGIVPDAQLSSPAALSTAGVLIPNAYIIVLQESANLDEHLTYVKQMHTESDSDLAGTTTVYEFDSFKGYAGHFDAVTVETLKAHPEVAVVSQDSVVTTMDVATDPHCQSEYLGNNSVITSLWGLGRVSHLEPPPVPAVGWSQFVYDDECPAGDEPTYAYVVDTGVNVSHPEFEGRATLEFVTNSDNQNWNWLDNCGHGTHVSGTIAGKTFGISKNSNIIGVKVLDGYPGGACGGSYAGVISGLQFVLRDASAKGRKHRSVVNMSLGGGQTDAVDVAVDTLVKAGITVVVAAGNAGDDTCAFSPAAASGAISVGAIDYEDKLTLFSNRGCCTSIFAPGLSIRSAWLNGTSASLSGTSMSSPHVAGVVLYNKCRRGYQTPEEDLGALRDHRYNNTGFVKGNLCVNSDVSMCKAPDFEAGNVPRCAPNRIVYNRACDR